VGDVYRFYEINPDVVEIAQRYFTYLSDTHASVETVLGDGRIALEREPTQRFDVLVLDAFSGDAVPAHLLTVEALDIYLEHLVPQGALAIHISNRHIDLFPVVARLCLRMELNWKHVKTRMEFGHGSGYCEWVVISRDAQWLDARWSDAELNAMPEGVDDLPVWTDNYSNILGALRQ